MKAMTPARAELIWDNHGINIIVTGEKHVADEARTAKNERTKTI